MTTHDSTEALQHLVSTQHKVLIEACGRLNDDLPGLLEAVQDHVVLSVAGSRRNAYGWFAHDAWRRNDEGRWVHEIFVNARLLDLHDDRGASAEQVLTTLIHEAIHCFGFVNDIRTSSRDGRYHPKRFGQLALQAHLAIAFEPTYGCTTPGLRDSGRLLFDDLLGELADALIIARVPKPAVLAITEEDTDEEDGDTTETPTTTDKDPKSRYVFVHCACPAAKPGSYVTVRVSRRSWHGQIGCGDCGCWFVEPGVPGVSDKTPTGSPKPSLPAAARTRVSVGEPSSTAQLAITATKEVVHLE